MQKSRTNSFYTTTYTTARMLRALLSVAVLALLAPLALPVWAAEDGPAANTAAGREQPARETPVAAVIFISLFVLTGAFTGVRIRASVRR